MYMICKKLVKYNNLLIIVWLVGLLVLGMVFAVSTALSLQGSMLRQWLLPVIMLFDDSAASAVVSSSTESASPASPATSADPTVLRALEASPVEKIRWWIYSALAGLALVTGIVLKRNNAIV